MESVLSIEQRNNVLLSMARLVSDQQNDILQANEKDLKGNDQLDIAMYDRLKVDQEKIDGMVLSLEQ